MPLVQALVLVFLAMLALELVIVLVSIRRPLSVSLTPPGANMLVSSLISILYVSVTEYGTF